MAVLRQIPFINEFKQAINPGDKVIVVSEGYQHSIHVREGTYRGMVGQSVSVSTCKVTAWDRRRGWTVKPTISTLQKNRIYPLV